MRSIAALAAALVCWATGARVEARRFATTASHLTVDGRPLTIRGVNLGAARPGTRPIEHAVDQATFERWFARMSELQINAIRVFDLQSPGFYRALAAHNRRGGRPLYLLQGVWLDEEPELGLWRQAAELDRRSAEAIDAIHGAADIGDRRFRAHGRYRADVSRWTLGLIVGREIHPAEIAAANAARPDLASFRGEHLALAAGSPAEVWVTGRLDAAIAYEASRYDTGRPVAAASWPLLDPLRHPGAEPGMDRASIDETRIDRSKAPSGLFAAYSIYPYYPRFIWREPRHREARDALGVNPFLGYLERLRAHYRGMPLVVAEYGVPSSPAVVARDPVAGMSFGGHDEAEQARINARLRRSVELAGCAGGVVFAWIDEWWKPTWILRGRSDAARAPLWHDRISPEQNFGMIGFEAEATSRSRTALGEGPVRAIELAATPSYLEIDVRTRAPATSVELGIDVGAPTGLSRLPGGVELEGERIQLALAIEPDRRPVLQVAATHDLSGLGGGDWRPWRWKTPAVETPGVLAVDAVERRTDGVRVRLSWSLLQFRDPSRHALALPGPDGSIEGRSPGVVAIVAIGGAVARSDRFRWRRWDRPPQVREREKPAARIYADQPLKEARLTSSHLTSGRRCHGGRRCEGRGVE